MGTHLVDPDSLSFHHQEILTHMMMNYLLDHITIRNIND